MCRFQDVLDYPVLILALSLLIFWLSALAGASVSKRRHSAETEADHEDFTLIVGATLTLLGLIIGFTFSMAMTRYDQRKNYEEEEANAIGTEYVRLDLLPATDAAKIRILVRSYLDQRVLYYKTRNEQQLEQISNRTAQLQAEMWSAVSTLTRAHLNPVMALVVAGMNDVLNTQGYTQAAWWNRVPIAAWTLLVVLSIFSNLALGYGAHRRTTFRFLILPIALSVSLFLIADIDSPRGGIIRVYPQNLERLAESLHSQ
jgi:hypothetical protein